MPADSVKVRLLTVLTSFAATYVITDMYSANLTSLLARPGRERPITDLEQLEEAMRTRGYQLLVEKHSFSLSTLENSTGIYNKLWFLARRQRTHPVVDSGEIGMLRVRDMNNFAMLGGRETLYFDTLRFGAYNFQLSQKLYSRSSAIAVQVGCPYIQSVNKILMQLFEAGILSKMTEEEYKKLGDKRYSRGPKHVPSTSTTPNFIPTESTATTGCSNLWDQTDIANANYDYDYSVGCSEPTVPSIETDDAGYPDYGYGGYPYYDGNQTWETEPPVSDSTVGSSPTPTPVIPAGGPLGGGLDGPLEGPDHNEGSRKARIASSEVVLKPISIRMLQGAFYVLLLGYGVAGFQRKDALQESSLLASLAICATGLFLLLEIATSRVGRSECSSRCPIELSSVMKTGRMTLRKLVVLAQRTNGVFARSAKSSVIDDRPESSSSTALTRFSKIASEEDESIDLETIPFCE